MEKIQGHTHKFGCGHGRSKVDIDPNLYIPYFIFEKLTQNDYDQIMEEKNASKRRVQEINRDDGSIPTRVVTDNSNSVISEVSRTTSIMGGMNERANMRNNQGLNESTSCR